MNESSWWKTDLDIVAAISAIVAIFLAIRAEFKLKNIATSAHRIFSSLYTRYVGSFPANMPEISKLIDQTKNKLIIICDIPSYGHFSNPEAFESYRKSIFKLKTTINTNRVPEIILVIYSKEKRKANAVNQFSNYKTYDELKNSTPFKNYFEYHKINPGIKEPADQTIEAFKLMLEERHVEFIKQLQALNVKIYECSSEFRVFTWLNDSGAIFSFHNHGSVNREVSFSTVDDSFLNVLQEISEETIKGSTELA